MQSVVHSLLASGFAAEVHQFYLTFVASGSDMEMVHYLCRDDGGDHSCLGSGASCLGSDRSW